MARVGGRGEGVRARVAGTSAAVATAERNAEYHRGGVPRARGPGLQGRGRWRWWRRQLWSGALGFTARAPAGVASAVVNWLAGALDALCET